MNTLTNNTINYIKQLRDLSCGQTFILFQKKIIKTNKEIIGVKVPEIRRLAKVVVKNNDYDKLENINYNCFEEVLLKTLVISMIKDKEQLKKEIEKIIKYFDCWAEVDTLASSIKIIDKNTQDFEWFKSFLSSEHEFIQRFGVVGLMKFFIQEEWLEPTFNTLKSIKCSKYYVDMAIAWLIAEVLIKNQQNNIKIMQKIIKNAYFSKFIINKAIQKACESYRINKNDKEILKGMKIK